MVQRRVETNGVTLRVERMDGRRVDVIRVSAQKPVSTVASAS